MNGKLIIACVILGVFAAFAGLCYHSGTALFIGVFVGGIMPMVAAEIEERL